MMLRVLSLASLGILCASQAVAPLFEWRFKDYDANVAVTGPNMVEDVSASAAKKHLDYTYVTDDDVQNKFQVLTDFNFGMQYSGQYSFHKWGGLIVPDEDFNWMVQIWFYTCITEDFMIFSIQEEETVSDIPADVTEAPFV